MQTDWQNYKSTKTNQIVGSYFYLPEKSDECLAHVYRLSSGMWRLHSFVAWARVDGSFASLGAAKLHAARAAAAHFVTPETTIGPLQGQLF